MTASPCYQSRSAFHPHTYALATKCPTSCQRTAQGYWFPAHHLAQAVQSHDYALACLSEKQVSPDRITTKLSPWRHLPAECTARASHLSAPGGSSSARNQAQPDR